MDPRIEIAEVVSFRLKLPQAELERLCSERGGEVPLSLARDRMELVLEATRGDSSLRFRKSGQDAVLAEIAICNDEGGLFFQRVLGPLLVRFRGDCELRLVWNVAERNTHGHFAAVTVRQGQTNYPGLSTPAQALRSTLTAGPAAHPGGEQAGAEAQAGSPDPVDEKLEREIDELLSKGRALFAEYQRLKTERRG
jgi:hypothetical protein